MLDFTQNIKLSNSDQKTYRVWQVLLYLAAFLVGMLLVIRILFPSEYFIFSFINFNSSKNTIIEPRNEAGVTKEKGNLGEGEKLFFDISSVGSFSRAVFDLELKDESSASLGDVFLKKSFRAFMYPEGDPLGFKEGTLLTNQNDFYIISGNRLRQFQSLSQAVSLGFQQKAFINVISEEIKFNEKGKPITSLEYPESSLFLIQGEFFQLKNGMLNKFISEQAFLSQYDEKQAIPQNQDFLNKYPLAEELIGFSDGTLISYADSVFIVAGKEILPIGDITIFEASGYNWDDIRKASGDEISLYEKGKIFPLSGVHPNGTVFVTKEDGEYYLIMNKQKRLLPSENIWRSWSKQNPILVSKEGLQKISSCQLKKESLDFGNANLTCEIDVSQISNFIGKDYEAEIMLNGQAELEQVSVKLKKIINRENWESAKASFASRLKRNYE